MHGLRGSLRIILAVFLIAAAPRRRRFSRVFAPYPFTPIPRASVRVCVRNGPLHTRAPRRPDRLRDRVFLRPLHRATRSASTRSSSSSATWSAWLCGYLFSFRGVPFEMSLTFVFSLGLGGLLEGIRSFVPGGMTLEWECAGAFPLRVVRRNGARRAARVRARPASRPCRGAFGRMITLSQRREVGEFRKALSLDGAVRRARVRRHHRAGRASAALQQDRWSGIAQQNITKTLELPATRGVIRDVDNRVVASNRPSYDVYATPRLLRPDDLARIASLMGLVRRTGSAAALNTRIAELPESAAKPSDRALSRTSIAISWPRSRRTSPSFQRSTSSRCRFATIPYARSAHISSAISTRSTQSDIRACRRPGAYRAGRSDRTQRPRETSTSRSFGARAAFGARSSTREAGRSTGHSSRLARGRDAAQAGAGPRHPAHARHASDGGARPGVCAMHPSGAAVVVDIHTGAVRALYSKPVYDPNEMSSGLSTRRYAELTADPFRPLIDKTIYETYFPGSTFKVFTALAALEDHVVDPGAASRVHRISSRSAGRSFAATSATSGSTSTIRWCSPATSTSGSSPRRSGIERINRFAQAFGFAERSGIGVNSEAKGFLATREWYRSTTARSESGTRSTPPSGRATRA